MDEDTITPIDELYAERGMRVATPEEFEAVCAAEEMLPPDGEG
jgi:hypothetical protein